MKSLFSFLIVLFLSFTSVAQDPVKWSATYKSISDTEGEIHITAAIDKGWHTYSQKETADGPIPTSFTFEESKNYTKVDSTTESEAHEALVPAFGASVLMFSEKASFVQKVKLKSKAGFPIKFKVEYMCCDNTMCLPPKTVDLMVLTKK